MDLLSLWPGRPPIPTWLQVRGAQAAAWLWWEAELMSPGLWGAPPLLGGGSLGRKKALP